MHSDDKNKNNIGEDVIVDTIENDSNDECFCSFHTNL
jgi:hypothetical protein